MNSPKTRALMIGGAVGLLIGVVSGLIYYNTNVEVDSEGTEALEAPTPGVAVKLGLGLLGVLRLIAD